MFRMPSLRVSRGLTIVELMVVVALAGIIFFGLATIYVMVMDWWDRGNSQLNLQRDGSYALFSMSTEIRKGSLALTPSSTELLIQNAAGSTMQQYYWETSDNTLRDISGQQVIPSLVDSLHFSITDQRTIYVTLVLADAEQQEAYFSTSASLRN
jgi:Tfp pilus assembly protein FimT